MLYGLNVILTTRELASLMVEEVTTNEFPPTHILPDSFWIFFLNSLGPVAYSY